MHTRQISIGKARSYLAADLRSLVTHSEQLLQATVTASGDGIDKARSKLSESLSQAKSQLASLETEAIERGRAALDTTTGLVRERPWQALAIAVLIGAIVGYLGHSGSSTRNVTA
ncbi:MAG: DUF883 family protein [Pseudomonadota bacterium]|nr:DUF883 family protein [Pseudomonadota bacterium]